MRVRVHLANINEMPPGIFVQPLIGFGRIAIGGGDKRLAEQSTHLIQSLMLDVNRVMQSVSHTEDGERQSAENQKFSRGTHGCSPLYRVASAASCFPV